MEDGTKSQNTEATKPALGPSQMSSGPVMDVVPPHTQQPTDPQEGVVEQEPNQPPTRPAEPDKPAVKPNKTSTQKPGPVANRPHTTPVAAILIAIIVFAMLTGLAYYAYTQG